MRHSPQNVAPSSESTASGQLRPSATLLPDSNSIPFQSPHVPAPDPRDAVLLPREPALPRRPGQSSSPDGSGPETKSRPTSKSLLAASRAPISPALAAPHSQTFAGRLRSSPR